MNNAEAIKSNQDLINDVLSMFDSVSSEMIDTISKQRKEIDKLNARLKRIEKMEKQRSLEAA